VENISSTEAKRDGAQLSNAVYMHTEDDFDQVESGRVTTLNELAHNLMLASTSEIQCFTSLPFKDRHPILLINK
jgi:hypothetical protein